MASIPRSKFHGHRAPPTSQWNSNRPRKNGPGCTPYHADLADLPQPAEDDSDEGISDAFSLMGFQDQSNSTTRVHPGLLSPLDGGRPISRQATPIHTQSPYSQPQQSATSGNRAFIQPSFRIRPSEGGYANSGSMMPETQYNPAMHTPINQAPMYDHPLNTYPNDTPFPHHYEPTPPPGRGLVKYVQNAREPKRRNTYPEPKLTEDQVAYHNSQYDTTSRPSHMSSAPSGSNRYCAPTCECSRPAAGASAASHGRSRYEPLAMVPYAYPTVLHPIIEHRLGPLQPIPPPQVPVVHSRTIQVSQSLGYHMTTYTEHQQVTLPSAFY